MIGGWIVASWLATAGGGELVLAPEGVVEAIGPGPIVRYVADRDGPVTFALDSFAMDAFLCATDARGMCIAAEDGGGIRQNARIVVPLRSGDEVLLECTTMNTHRWSGRFTLSARAGDVPPPTGAARDAVEGEFYRAYAQRYLVVGDPRRAVEALVSAGRLLLNGEKAAEAYVLARDAVRSADLLREYELAINAESIASRAAERGGDAVAAITHAASAFARAMERADSHASAVTALRLGTTLLTSGRLAEARLAFEVGRESAIAAAVDDVRAWIELGLAQVAVRDDDLAIADDHLAAAAAHAGANPELADRIELERATLAHRRLRFVDARRRLETLIARAEAAHEWSLLGSCRAALALVHDDASSDFAAAERELEAAERAFDRAGEVANALGARFGRLRLGHEQAELDHERGVAMQGGASATALRELDDVIDRAQALGAPWIEASARLMRAEWSELAGDDTRALTLAQAAEHGFAERVGSTDGALRARRVQAVIALRRGDVAFAADALDRALAFHAARERANGVDEAIGARVNAEAWSKLAVDVAAALVRSGHDPALAFLRCAAWRDRAMFMRAAPIEVADAQRFVQRVWPASTRFVDYARGKTELYAFVADGRRLRMIELGPWRALIARCDAYAALVGTASTDATKLVPDGRALFDALLAPVVDDAVTRLVLSPGEAFAMLPFDALLTRDPAPDARIQDLPFAVRSLQIDLVPSWRACVGTSNTEPSSSFARIVVIGDPRPTPLPALPGAEREALGIAALARDQFGDATRVDLLVGAAATRVDVLGVLADADLLHVAAHADVDRRDPSRTGVWLAGSERLTLADLGRTRLRARLTVLSTCSSAVGQRRSGSGVLSTANGFLDAGSRGVIATRFPVDDSAADLFQRRFYRALWQRGLAAPAALRATKLEFLDGSAEADPGWPRGRAVRLAEATPQSTTAHPSRWAAYVYAGTDP